MSHKFKSESWPLDEDEHRDAIRQALRSLVREGLIVDSGRRQRNEETRRYHIVWVTREFVDPNRQKS